MAQQGEQPAWSPDGRLIAYVDPNHGLTLMRSDGSGRRLLNGGSDPAWSPDGKRIVTVTGEGGTFIDILTVSTGRTVRLDKLTDCGNGCDSYAEPAWAPDGRRIAFATASQGIVLYDLARRRIEHPRFNQANVLAAEPLNSSPAHPSWSPTGSSIAFDKTGLQNSNIVARSSSVFVARVKGMHVRRLARNASQPVWSPDGREIVFARLVARSNAELFVMNADGTHQRRITVRPGWDAEPDWQRLPVR